MKEKIQQYILFIKECEKLKGVLRTAWGSDGRRESTADHTWRLALLAAVFLEDYPELDREKVLKMCLIHDLGEIYGGDISAALLPEQTQKYIEEYSAVQKVFGMLPELQKQRMLKLWKEYNENETEEAHLVKALDKAETILQHNQGKNPEDFDYNFNLQYGREYFQKDYILEELRSCLDQETKQNIKND